MSGHQSYQSNEYETYEESQQSHDDAYKREVPHKVFTFAQVLIGVAFVVLAFFGILGVTGMGKSGQSFFKAVKPSYDQRFKTSSYTVEVNVTFDSYGQPNSLSMLPWDFLSEPYKTQTIEITEIIDGDASLDVTDATVTWTIDSTIYTGVSTRFSINATGIYDSTVTVVIGSSTYSRSFTIANKYIRREIRSLTDEDRDEYFDALLKLYEVDQETGEATYGSNYASAEYLLAKHLNGAGRSDCDHWHDGAGKMTQTF